MSSVQAVKENVERGKLKLIKGIVQEALDAGCTPEDLLNQGMIDSFMCLRCWRQQKPWRQGLRF